MERFRVRTQTGCAVPASQGGAGGTGWGGFGLGVACRGLENSMYGGCKGGLGWGQDALLHVVLPLVPVVQQQTASGLPVRYAANDGVVCRVWDLQQNCMDVRRSARPALALAPVPFLS